MLDVPKAFDRVDHQLLCEKIRLVGMEKIRLVGIEPDWFVYL